VEKGTPGFTATKIEDKFSLRTVQNADLAFTDCRIPAENKLEDGNSFKDVNKVLKVTRGGVAWSGVGCQLGAYEVALAYAKERQQFGKPIGSFQLVQDLLARMLGNVTASLGMTVRISQLQEVDALRDDQASLAKSYVTARGRETVAWARELFGGNGIVLDHDVIRFFADAEALYSYEGTESVGRRPVTRTGGRGSGPVEFRFAADDLLPGTPQRRPSTTVLRRGRAGPDRARGRGHRRDP
jgi:glutaryl-CoA dehydrogenase